jgi:hypothetical protein
VVEIFGERFPKNCTEFWEGKNGDLSEFGCIWTRKYSQTILGFSSRILEKYNMPCLAMHPIQDLFLEVFFS